MIDLSNIKNYYIACGYTDLRRGIDGLAQIVMLQYGYEIDENSLFLFCGRRTDRIKALSENENMFSKRIKANGCVSKPHRRLPRILKQNHPRS